MKIVIDVDAVAKLTGLRRKTVVKHLDLLARHPDDHRYIRDLFEQKKIADGRAAKLMYLRDAARIFTTVIDD